MATASDDMEDTERAMTILIVDDVVENIEVLAGVFEDAYDVRFALSGADALSAMESGDIDLVLLDVMMPDMDGYEVCRRLKAEPRTCEVPIIFVTARDDEQDEETGLAIGAVDYISKPISRPILLTRVKTHLSLKEARDQLRKQNEILEERVRRRTHQLSELNHAMARFVPEHFLQLIRRQSITETRLGDYVSKEMTIMFVDIRSFTRLIERMTPRQSFDFVNAFFARVNPAIRQKGGVIVKYTGDGFMAVFADDPAAAVHAGVDVVSRVRAIENTPPVEGLPPVRVGVGVHTGTALLGVIGEETRMQADAMADSVNVAARLEGLTRHYQVSLVISDAVLTGMSDAGSLQHRFLDRVVVHGREGEISIHEVFSADPPDLVRRKQETLPILKRGQEHYYAGRFGDAVKCFTDVLADLPDDVTTKLYLQRSSGYLLEGAPEGWLGVHGLTAK
jgi:CheY-like chemotaxis protein/class 3 adenylate cyclase